MSKPKRFPNRCHAEPFLYNQQASNWLRFADLLLGLRHSQTPTSRHSMSPARIERSNFTEALRIWCPFRAARQRLYELLSAHHTSTG